MNDDFVDVTGYEGLYKINKEGDIWSCYYKRLLKINMCKGYKRIQLSKNNTRNDYFIHRLIAINFIPNPDNLPFIDHRNRIKTDNRIENLRWVTKCENCQNVTKNKNNTSGYKNICIKINNKYENWCIEIKYNNNTYQKKFSKTKYTLEEVVDFRNQKYIEFGLEKYD